MTSTHVHGWLQDNFQSTNHFPAWNTLLHWRKQNTPKITSTWTLISAQSTFHVTQQQKDTGSTGYTVAQKSVLSNAALFLVLDGRCAAHATRPPGSNETHLLARGCIAAHRGRVPDMLMVTTTVGMLHRVHGNTTDLQEQHHHVNHVNGLLPYGIVMRFYYYYYYHHVNPWCHCHASLVRGAISGCITICQYWRGA